MKRFYFFLLLGLLLVGCDPITDSPTLSAAEETANYSAVVRQLVTVDDTFGGTLQPSLIYIISETNDQIGDPDIEQLPPQIIAVEMQNEISATLSDLPGEIIWIEGRENVEISRNTGEVVGGGIIVTLGNIHHQEDGTLLISGSIYIANLAAGGQTYVLEQVDGQWTITGNTGVQWIS